jgi:chaperonin GroES
MRLLDILFGIVTRVILPYEPIHVNTSREIVATPDRRKAATRILLDLALVFEYIFDVINPFLYPLQEEYAMKVNPLLDRVLIKVTEGDSKSAGGIIIPQTAQEKTQTGVVISVGSGTEKDPIKVKVGDKVMYDKYAGTQVKIDGNDHLIVKMADILAIIE